MKAMTLFLLLCVGTANAQDAHLDKFQKVQAIFNLNCITCHSGSNPAGGLALSAGESYKNLVNVPANEDGSVKRISPNQPENSYLFRKLMREKERFPFDGDPMPLDAPKLSAESIATLAEWINSFPTELWGEPGAVPLASAGSEPGENELFLATQLINLPTTRVLGSRTSEFRIMHRFGLINGGGGYTYGSFFGLDNHAYTSIQMAVALTSNIDLLLRRTNPNKDVELGIKYVPYVLDAPLHATVGFYGSLDWISRDEVIAKNKLSFNAQAMIGTQIFPKLSLLIVPTLAGSSNHNSMIAKSINDSTARFYKDTRSTSALGIGMQYEFKENAAVTGEYIWRTGGYRGNAFANDRRFNTWSLGMAYKVRLHVFELMISNTQYIHSTQYIAGSSTIAKNSIYDRGWNFHFGFNIYRQFKW